MNRFGMLVLGTGLVFAASAQAGSVFHDFNGESAPGISLRGDASLVSNGGLENSGRLRLTPAINEKIGAAVLSDLDPGQAILGFTATYHLRQFDGSGADGSSFNFGSAPIDGAFGEAGYLTPHSLTVSFDTFDNFGEAPGINLYVNGDVKMISKTVSPRGDAYIPVTIHLDGDGLDVTYGQVTVFTNFDVAALGFTPLAGDVFGLGGRTGSMNDDHGIDNLRIDTLAPQRVVLDDLQDVRVVPLPSAAWMGLGLLGMIVTARMRKLAA